MSRVEPDLSAGSVPKGLELLLERGTAGRAEVKDEGAGHGLVELRVVDVSNKPVGSNLIRKVGVYRILSSIAYTFLQRKL